MLVWLLAFYQLLPSSFLYKSALYWRRSKLVLKGRHCSLWMPLLGYEFKLSLYKILITQYYEINCLLNLVHCFRLTGYSKMESCTCNSNLSFLRTIDTQLFWFVPILEHTRQSMQNAMKFWGDTQGNGLWRCTVLISRTKWTSFPVISYM